MNQFKTLYGYEWKKLLDRKIVRVTFLLCVAVIAISLLAPLSESYYVDGEAVDTHYHLYLKDKQYEEALTGREIDQSLLEETVAAYRKIPQALDRHYTLTEEYEKYARPYSAIFNFIHGTTGMQPSEVMFQWEPDENDLYARRQAWLNSLWEEMWLSEGEIAFWQQREAQIKTPYVYREHGGYDEMFLSFQTVGVLSILFISICLAGLFPDEHTRKTDQMILSSPLGKSRLYWAKIAAGASFAAVSTFLFCGAVFIVIVAIYGAEGFQTVFQLMYYGSSAPITCGQAILIAYGIMILTAVIVGVSVMILSELLHSNIAAMAVSTGLLIAAMVVNVPAHYRVLAQIWNWLPWSFLAPWNVFGEYTVSLFGHYFTPWQAVPALYLFAGAGIALAGKQAYGRYQVAGR